MLEDRLSSFWAGADVGFRVTAKISKGALRETRLLMSEPPCLPVAPVIRMALMWTVVWGILRFAGSCEWNASDSEQDLLYINGLWTK